MLITKWFLVVFALSGNVETMVGPFETLEACRAAVAAQPHVHRANCSDGTSEVHVYPMMRQRGVPVGAPQQ